MTECEECGIEHNREPDDRFKDLARRTLKLAQETTDAMVDIAASDGISLAELGLLCRTWENALVAVFSLNTAMQISTGEQHFPDVEVDRDWVVRYIDRLTDGFRDSLTFYTGDVLSENGYGHLDPRFNEDVNAKVRAEILSQVDGS